MSAFSPEALQDGSEDPAFGFLGRCSGSFFRGHDLFDADSTPWLTAEGRLKPGRTRAEARSELAVIASQLDRLEPGRQTTMRVTNGSFGEEPTLRGSLFWIGPVVMGALTLILLIACTNVTVLSTFARGDPPTRNGNPAVDRRWTGAFDADVAD